MYNSNLMLLSSWNTSSRDFICSETAPKARNPAQANPTPMLNRRVTGEATLSVICCCCCNATDACAWFSVNETLRGWDGRFCLGCCEEEIRWWLEGVVVAVKRVAIFQRICQKQQHIYLWLFYKICLNNKTVTLSCLCGAWRLQFSCLKYFFCRRNYNDLSLNK